MMPFFDMATQAVHFTECKGRSRTSSGDALPQKIPFLLFTWPDRRKCASSENHTSSRKSRSISILSQNHWHMTTLLSSSTCVNFYLIWILYAYRWRCLFSIRLTDSRAMPSSWLWRRINFFGLRPTQSLTAATLSAVSALKCRPVLTFPALELKFYSVPDLLNLFTHR